jgi:hypothetical protein
MLLEQKRYLETVELLSAAEPAARKTYTGAREPNLGSFLQNLGAARAGLEKFATAESAVLEAHARPAVKPTRIPAIAPKCLWTSTPGGIN